MGDRPGVRDGAAGHRRTSRGLRRRAADWRPGAVSGPRGCGPDKIDLGAEWTRLTGLPFVWAFWAGRPGVIAAAGITALQEARDRGVRDSDGIAEAYCRPPRERATAGFGAAPDVNVCRAYLRDNIKYRMGDREAQGLRQFYDFAATHGVVESSGQIEFY